MQTLCANDSAVRLTGRFARIGDGAVTTALGSYIEIAFRGDMALLHFDLDMCMEPHGHVWIQMDGGAMAESSLDWHLRVRAGEKRENHVVRIIYKSDVERFHRWHSPLIAKMHFLSADVEAAGVLPPDERKIIEFVGDSITEGILIDTDYSPKPTYQNGVYNRVYQDDACATYGWLTAEALNMRPILMGYGAVGTTKGGNGGVPHAALAYPYAYDKAPYALDAPDLIVVNHGANDRGKPMDEYLPAYDGLLQVIANKYPDARIAILSPFSGVFDEALKGYQEEYNRTHAKQIWFIGTAGWIPEEPVHPLRGGHLEVATRLAPILKEYMKREPLA